MVADPVRNGPSSRAWVSALCLADSASLMEMRHLQASLKHAEAALNNVRHYVIDYLTK